MAAGERSICGLFGGAPVAANESTPVSESARGDRPCSASFPNPPCCHCDSRPDFHLKRIAVMNGAWNLEVHNPAVGRGSLMSHYEGLSGAVAVSLMEQHADKALLLRESGQPTEADHDALQRFQLRTGKRLLRQW